MKRVIPIILCIVQLFNMVNFPVSAETDDGEFWSQVSKMVGMYTEDGYFSTMTVTIGESEISIDGEQKPIDESDSVPYIENGRTMMPVRGLAEAIGAEVSYDDLTQTVTVENSETVVAMTIGANEMEVNGRAVSLLTAPELVNDRTMLPIRDVAEALDCDVEWDAETETAVFTRPLQTKRIIAYSENADASHAIMSASGAGMTVMQFATIEEAEEAVARNEQMGIYTEPDYVRKMSSMSWGISSIGPEKYYSQVDYASGDAIVAVVDSGVDYSHSYFNGKLVNGYDIINDDSYPEDQLGHGTHVSSTVLDVAGYNADIKIMPVKVFGEESSTSTLIIAQAIEYATEQGVDVINLSLGGEGLSWCEEQAVNKALDKNIAVVAAAGNEKLNLENTYYHPACIEGVITVSAMNESGYLATFSNYGAGIVDFTAPGVSIKGAKLGGGYCTKSGTSMATPHVAGVYALAKAAHPDMDVADITAGLKKNATDKGNARYYGAGLVNVANLESKLSSMYYSNVKIDSVTTGNAVISGEIGYKGIIPEYIGVKLGSTEIYSTRFREDEYDTMYFECDLNEDAGYTLKSGTAYEALIFTNQGGYVLNTKAVGFTTEGNKDDNEPDPEKSTLRILPDSYPQGDIQQGNSFSLSGRIKSDCHITDVRSYILDASGRVVQESSGWTTTQTYVIENSKLDTGLKFGNLSPGTYFLQYKAEDESGNSITWKSDSFRVVAKETPEKSTLNIAPVSYPQGSLAKGNKFSLSGRIKSNYHITDVRSYLLDASGNVVQESSGWTTTQTYVIEKSKLDTGLKFEQLPVGGYYLKYTAADESGNRVSWQSGLFYVVDAGGSKSALRIEPDAYPQGELKKGKSFTLSGRIKSDCHITDVRAYMLNADKEIIMDASGWTTTQTYVIKGSALDKGMKFNDLETGGYYLQYVASDESGNNVTWTSELFYVVP